MKNIILKKITVALLLTVVFVSTVPFVSCAQNAKTHKVNTLVILFTGDMHSCVDKYPRIAAFINQERKAASSEGGTVVTVDAGDIAMGSVFSAVTNIEATEYRELGLMGYDAYVFGNHDFDIGLKSLAFMFYNANIHGRNFNAITKQPIQFPVNVTSNLGVTKEETFEQARKYIGQQPYIILNRGGMKIGIFGLLGKGAFDVSNQKEDMTLLDPIESAKKIVSILKGKGVDFIICLSHSGSLLGEKSEDGILAKKCPDIDVIISGHDHNAIFKPWKVGNVLIASAGSHGELLGEMALLKGGKNNPIVYRLEPIPGDIVPDPASKMLMDSTELKVIGKFNQQFSVSPFDVIATQNKRLNSVPEKDGSFPLAYSIARSYFCQAVRDYNGGADTTCMISCVPAGVVRNELRSGRVTYSDVFNVLPLGIDKHGKLGYQLIETWITGKELKKLCEVNVSIAGKVPDAFLTFYGLSYTYNSARLPFTRVTKVYVHGKEAEESKLYHIITGYYTAMCIDVLNHNSHGLLKILPKNSEGAQVHDIDQMILGHHVAGYKDPQGTNEWYAFAEFLRDHGSQPDVIAPAGKDERNASVQIKYAGYAIAGIAVIILIIIAIIKIIKASSKKHGKEETQ